MNSALIIDHVVKHFPVDFSSILVVVKETKQTNKQTKDKKIFEMKLQTSIYLIRMIL